MVMSRRTLGGVSVDLCEETDVFDILTEAVQSSKKPALAIASANLDHIYTFSRARSELSGVLHDGPDLRWLVLADGVPLLAKARRVTGHRWPRLAGADLLLPILTNAAAMGVTVGFLGGTNEMHDALAARLQSLLPSLKVGGYWAPSRSQIDDPQRSVGLADDVARAKVQILVVGLGKPFQERWIQAYAARTKARVLLAFGAAAGFVAGVDHRAPAALQQRGLEWAYRLAREPRRLARRYLVQGPPTALRLAHRPSTHLPEPHHSPRDVRRVAVVVVTHNNERDIARLLDSVPHAAPGLDVVTLVVDNGSTDGTRVLASRPDVTLIETGSNLGFAGGINVARRSLPDGIDALAILNPDLVLGQGSLTRLAQALSERDVGVCVPTIFNPDGSVYQSLHREPTVMRAVGEAAFGSHWRTRPAMLSDTVRSDAAYVTGGTVDWASGACWMVASDCDREVGPWDESFFLYSEEVDYARRVRSTGFAIEFVPGAAVKHVGGGSGGPSDLGALMAVNRVRDYERHHGHAASVAFRAAVELHYVLRSVRHGDRRALAAVARRSSWASLPGGQDRDHELVG